MLTGGPCGGKTTALCFVEEKLRSLGYNVLLVHEAATELISAGVRPKETIHPETFQEILFTRVLQTEQLYRDIAKRLETTKETVIIFDRGRMDMRAYTTEKHFMEILRSHGMTVVDARDKCYDGVFHLHSLAHDKESLYEELWRSNPARSESNPAEAREKNRAVLNAWIGCPHLFVFSNDSDFETKLNRLWGSMCRVLGIPVPLEIERKFLVRCDAKAIPVQAQKIDIEQAYLPTQKEGEELRIRRRGKDGSWVCYMTHKFFLKHGVRSEHEHHIDAREYFEFFRNRDRNFHPIEKDRYCFVWDNQYFELDVFLAPHEGLQLLEIELTEESSAVSIPPFVEIIKEVTCDLSFSNKELSRKTA